MVQRPSTVGAELGRVLAAERGLVDHELHQLQHSWHGVPARLSAAMRYALAGGKRVRSALMILAYRAAGGRRLSSVLPFCSGVEMIHAFSLVHDDLPCMDDDDFRRGRPALHRAFGEGLAVLAADALLVNAFELFVTAPVTDRLKLEATRIIASAVGPCGMTAGQALDTAEAGASGGRRHRSAGPGPARAATSLERVNRLKTADFMASCIVVGAVLGGLAARKRPALQSAGVDVGQLFQLTDDLLDAGQDVGPGLVALRGEQWVRRRIELLAARAGAALRRLGPGFEVLASVPGLIAARRS